MADTNKYITKEPFPKKVDRVLLLDVLKFLKCMFEESYKEEFNPFDYWEKIEKGFDNDNLSFPILIRGGGADVSKLIKLKAEYEKKEDEDVYYHFASQIIRLCCGIPEKGRSSCMALTLRKFRQLVYNIVMLTVYYQYKNDYKNGTKSDTNNEMIVVLYNIFNYTKSIYISDISVSSLVFVAIHKIE